MFVVAMVAALVLGHAVVPQHAAAQQTDAAEPARAKQKKRPTRADRREAKRLFNQAQQALVEGRFEEGRDFLEQSAELVPHQSTWFNLAIAYRRTGQTLKSMSLLQALLADEYGAISESGRARIAKQLAGALAELGTIEVQILGIDDATIDVGGLAVGDTNNGRFTAQVDAGTHVVKARAPKFIPISEEVTVEPGRRAQVTLQFKQIHAISPEVVVKEVRVNRRRMPWWGWTLIGAAIVGGGVTAGVLIPREREDAPVSAPPFGTVQALQKR